MVSCAHWPAALNSLYDYENSGSNHNEAISTFFV